MNKSASMRAMGTSTTCQGTWEKTHPPVRWGSHRPQYELQNWQEPLTQLQSFITVARSTWRTLTWQTPTDPRAFVEVQVSREVSTLH